MKKYQLVCMSFDGEYKREAPTFETKQEVWEYANDIGSKWYFYPFYFVVSGSRIVDAPYMFERFEGRYLKTVAREFKEFSESKEAEGLNVEEYVFAIA